MVERFYQRLKERYEANEKSVTLRFSPGYCDWPIMDQKKIFEMLNTLQDQVQLTETCLMKPRKSISGIFGVLPSNGKDSNPPYNPCLYCGKRDCIARRN
jgi:cobalamin-dependent methionine synthase I